MANEIINLVAPAGGTPETQAIKVKQPDGSTITFSRTDATPGRPQLRAPVISIVGTTLTIANPAANGAFVAQYVIYIDGTETYRTTNTTFELTKSKEVRHVAVKARGSSFVDSPFSNLVTYGGRASTRKRSTAVTSNTTTPQTLVVDRGIVAGSIIAGDAPSTGLEDVTVMNSIARAQNYNGVGTVKLKQQSGSGYADFKTIEASPRSVVLNETMPSSLLPDSYYGGISGVNFSLGANIIESNIRQGVTILGKTGTYAGPQYERWQPDSGGY